MNLVKALRQFNRKERYWLIRNALGPGSGQLGEDFRYAIGALLGIQIPEDAWWAMDYHLDWLVGALALKRDSRMIGKAQPNPDTLVQGNQEDIDLVVAFGNTLILIEAKGDTSWSNTQLNSKVPRLENILGEVGADPSSLNHLSVYFILMSPKESEQLKRKPDQPWPVWMLKDGKPMWIPMRMAEAGLEPAFLRVVRCKDADGLVGKEGSHWKIDHSASKASYAKGERQSRQPPRKHLVNEALVTLPKPHTEAFADASDKS